MRRAAVRRSELRAVELLCTQNFTSIFDLSRPRVCRLSLPVSVYFDTFADYAKKTGIAQKDLALHAGTDGLTVRHGGKYLVLYDGQVENERRVAFTLAHEIGHILLAHAGGEDAVCEEREANAFAASLLCPAVAAYYLAKKEGCPITPDMLYASFFLSREAAMVRARELTRRKEKRAPAEAEITLLLQLFGRTGGEGAIHEE